MSKLFVDQVDPKTATTLTLGTSGDTVTVPSGVTLSIASGATIANSGTATGIGGDNKPFFHAYASGNFACANATFVDMPCNTDSGSGFDTDNAFDTSTYKFTPQTAGYYWFAAGARTTSAGAWDYQSMRIRKNGTEFAVGVNDNTASDGTLTCNASGSIYLNGSSDYVTATLYQSSGGSIDYYGGLGSNYFTGFKLIGT
mgnify:FL=1|tara:strand:- start:1 stop:597 length:597 start_codon:yes stop_codon:yes gene_type:complete